jgi:hypothetical protein
MVSKDSFKVMHGLVSWRVFLDPEGRNLKHLSGGEMLVG